MKPILGIETSCDETAAAVLDAHGKILAEVVFSQIKEHAAFGGVVPEIAARAHLKYLPGLVHESMTKAGVAYADLGAVAATSGPGLIGGLIVGCQFGKGAAIAHDLPFLAINHLEAHALSARLPGLSQQEVTFPYLLMLLSGGHSLCMAVSGLGRYQRLGSTIDDAVGEAFDKVAKLLGLPWPGGPALETLASQGDPRAFPFPRPMLRRPGCDLSFSGLKTAVAQTIHQRGNAPLGQQERADLAASFQQAVLEVVADRASNACEMMRVRFPEARIMVVAGGVAANKSVRAALTQAAERHGFLLLAPPPRLCSDNAVMVAWAGIERLRAGLVDDIGFKPVPRWPLETLRGATP
ncbi:MAG TPA: tRNA (adenosine(37)-N6)-threonylcarbamoyltransferase complex transferase subunit TsaD [Rhodopila sp.]|nr:tRNA (adenosine(37)-N6)-threonylcarbamoyltransferase complex transferase subunit TsaD [Rhodopila sp.]